MWAVEIASFRMYIAQHGYVERKTTCIKSLLQTCHNNFRIFLPNFCAEHSIEYLGKKKCCCFWRSMFHLWWLCCFSARFHVMKHGTWNTKHNEGGMWPRSENKKNVSHVALYKWCDMKVPRHTSKGPTLIIFSSIPHHLCFLVLRCCN